MKHPLPFLLLCSTFLYLPAASYAEVKKPEITSHFYYFKRDRQRFDTASDRYENNLRHDTAIATFNIENISLANHIELKAGAYAVGDISMRNDDKVHQENEFSFAAHQWGDNYRENDNSKSYSGISYSNLAVRWQPTKNLTLNVGYDQFYLEGLIGTNWSYIPGTTRGISTEYVYRNASFRYVFVDRYKAPWFEEVQRFSSLNAWDASSGKFDIQYLQGASVATKLSLFDLSLSIAESEDYMVSQFFKIGYITPNTKTHNASYQLYRSDTNSQFDNGSHGYQGIAWLQALTYQLALGNYQVSIESTYVKAAGALGNYLPRLTRGYGNSQGALQIWWDLRSDWNHHNEKAIYLSLKRSLNDWITPQGWAVKLSAAHGWDAEYAPAALKNGRESAWAFDLIYQGSLFSLKDVTAQLHFLDYKNHQDELGDWAFPNMFSSEKDLHIKLSIPIL